MKIFCKEAGQEAYMIVGIGNDIIEIERVKRACEKENFLKRIYTEKEIALFAGKAQSLAGNFAVKEAVAKAFGTGFTSFTPKDIEVLRNEQGKPYVKLTGQAKRIAGELGVKKIFVSISNLEHLASAVAVLEKEDDDRREPL